MSRIPLRDSMLVARIYPPEFVQRLTLAAATHDRDEIDRVIDELHQRGYCEKRAPNWLLNGNGKRPR